MTIFTCSKYPSNIQVNLAKDIASAERWFRENKLKLNVNKTEYMLITNTRCRHYFQNIKVKVGGRIVEEQLKIKILGVTMCNDLSWDAHTSNLINSLKYTYRSFSRSCKLLTLDSRKLLYNAAIASKLNYCDTIWDTCSVGNVNRLQTIQNRCARVILGRPPGTSAAPLLQELGWLNLAYKRKLHKCVLLYKLLKGEGPQVLLEMLETIKNDATKVTRGTINQNLSLPTHKTNHVGRSFFCDAAKLWNSIPLTIKQTNSTATFKEKLNKHFLYKMAKDHHS